MNFMNMEIPVIQGGMGIGVSLGGLAGAVAKEGGAGTISAAQIGYREADFIKNPLETNLCALEKELKKAKNIAQGRGAIGVNIMAATRHYDAYVKKAVEAGADFIVSGAGLPMKLPSLTKGSKVKLIPIVSSKKAAAVICRRWWKKDGKIPDAIVIEGPKAGGHLGFSKEQIRAYNIEEKQNTTDKYEEEIREIIDFVRQFGQEQGQYIPVFTAGGYRTKADLLHQLELGADGIQAASIFVTTEECDANPNFKQAYIASKKEDICIVDSPVGMPGRAICNSFVKRAKEENIPPKHCYGCLLHCNPTQTPYCISEALIQAVRGNTEEGLIFCGANSWKEDKIRTVKEVMETFWL